jgi:hypothetical protein
VKRAKTAWVAAVLALALGGPGCFYLGWRRGAKATLVWLLVVSFILLGTLSQVRFGRDATLEPTVLFLILLQAALAWFAYRSCKRRNAEAAKAANSADPGAMQTDAVTWMMDRNLQPKVEPDCSKN